VTRSSGAGPDDQLTTDPPRPPGTADVDALVGDPVAEAATPEGGSPTDGGRSRPGDEDVTDGSAPGGGDGDPVSVEPPD
jgi:hypothetical protein